MGGGGGARRNLGELLEGRETATARQREYPDRIASRIGERVEFVELARVTHFFASDKLTYAATAAKNYTIDHTIQELEEKLDPRKFIRIDRATLVNVDSVQEL